MARSKIAQGNKMPVTLLTDDTFIANLPTGYALSLEFGFDDI